VGQGDQENAPVSPDFPALLAAARGGNAQSLGALLQSFQPYLSAIARRSMPDDLRNKCDHADLVQDVLLEAHRGFAGFDGETPYHLAVWLRGILRHNLLDLVRRYRDAAKRAVGLERSLDAGLQPGAFSQNEVDPYPTPCTQSMARERVAALQRALSRLPEDEQSVIRMHHFDSLTFQEIGLRMGRSSEAARKLWSRAMARLLRILEVTTGTQT
jgi:RNA polymerase sigma-70 factor (ECF subfamily)